MITFKDYLSASNFKNLQQQVLDKNTSWKFLDRTAHPNSNNDIFDFSWANIAIEEGQPNSELYQVTLILLDSLVQNGNAYGKVFRARYGLITAQQESKIHLPHVDYDFPHTVCLFYIDGFDGETLIYDLKYDYGTLDSFQYYEKHKESCKVKYRIKPEPNKLIIFNGAYYHSSSVPTLVSKRIVLNINLI